MKPGQQSVASSQAPSPYRHNYHINPAESKIIYHSPQNAQPSNNHQMYPPQSHQMMPLSQNVQSSSGQYVQQPQILTNQPIRAQSSSPIQSYQYSSKPIQNSFMSPPSNMMHSFQPLSPSKVYPNQQNYSRVDRPVSSHDLRTIQPSNLQMVQSNPQLTLANQPIPQQMNQVVQSNYQDTQRKGPLVQQNYGTNPQSIQLAMQGGLQRNVVLPQNVQMVETGYKMIPSNNLQYTQSNQGLSQNNRIVNSIPYSNGQSVSVVPMYQGSLVSNSSGVSFSYQNKGIGSSPIMQSFGVNTTQSMTPKIVESQKPKIQNSVVNINLHSTVPTVAHPLTLIQTETSPKSYQIQAQYAENVQSVKPTNKESQFHMTESLDYNSIQNNKQVQPPKTTQLNQASSAGQIPQPIVNPYPQPVINQEYVQQSAPIQYSQGGNQQYGQPVSQIQETSQNYTENAEQVSSNPIWEQRFIMIYQKFEWFYERYDFISREFSILSQDFENVNSEDEWLELKEKHDLLLQKIQEIQEELVNTIHQNQELAEQYELQNRNSKESDQVERVWEHRYHQLLEEYKSLSQNYADLQSQGNNINNTSQSQHSQPKGGLSLEEQAELQAKFHQLQNEYNVLCDQYQKIRVEYERIYEENTQYNKENNELLANHEQARNMAGQLQAYVQQLQQENDTLRKQERKSTPSLENFIPKEQVEKLQYQFAEEIHKYEEELQKYRNALEQYEEKSELNRQELEKISEIAMQRQNKIKQLETSQNNNAKSNHSNPQNMPNDETPQWERTYVSRLQHEIKEWKEKEIEYVHKLELREMERRSLQEKIHYLERQFQVKKTELDRLGKNFDEKLLRIQQNTLNQHGASRHIIEEESVRPVGNLQYQSQINQLQHKLSEMQSLLNAKMNNYRELEACIEQYQEQLRKQSNSHSMTQIQYQKRISEVQIQMSKKLAEKEMKVTIMNSEIQRLQEALTTSNKEISNLKLSYGKQREEQQRSILQKYNSGISQLQKKMQEKQNQLSYAKQLIQKLQKDNRTKHEELSELRNYLTQLKKNSSSSNIPSKTELSSLREQLRTKEQIIERKNDELNKAKREKEFKVKEINQLQHELQEVNSELTKKRTQTSSLKRQLSELQATESEIEAIKSSLQKKIQQNSQLKSEVFEMQKLRMEFDSLNKDFERAVQQNRQKHNTIQKLKQQLFEVQTKLSPQIKGVGKNQAASSNKSSSKVQWQSAQMSDLLRKKDSQISKLNQALQQNQYLLEAKTKELQISKSQSSALIRSKDSEISSLSHTVCSLEGRLKESQSRKNKLNDEMSELRINLEQQLKSESLRHKTYYDKLVLRHEEDYKGLKEKLRASEELNNRLEVELQKSRTQEKNLAIEIKEANNRVMSQQAQSLEKEELLNVIRQKQSQSEQSTKALYQKLSAVELQLKTKEQQLKLSEEKNAILEQKIKKNKKDYETFRNKLIVSQQYENNNSVVEYLSKRIAEYESKMINQSERDFGFKVKDEQANQVFENHIVYHLKVENEMLRKELEGKGIQFDRKILNQLEQENLKRSKNLLKNSSFSSKLGNISSQFIFKDNIEDINFYKEKNKELEERVEKHLKVNKELKQKIQSLIKANTDSKEIDYFKEQINEYELKVAQLEKKIQVLTEQNKTISKGMSKRQSRVQDQFEERIKQLEYKLSNATKTIQQLSQQKSELQILKSEHSMQKTILNDQIKRLNEKITTFTNSKSQLHEEQSQQLRERCDEYETEITKLSNKCKVLQSQIQRLNEALNTSKLSVNELGNLKVKVNELTQTLSRSQNSLHEEQIKSNSLGNELVMAQQKCKFLENQIERLKEINELYVKKQKTDLSESTVLKQSTSSIQIQISSLQNELSSLQTQLNEVAHQKALLENDNYQLNEELHRTTEQISQMAEQIRFYQSSLKEFEFNLELLRSDELVQDSLLDELVLGADNVSQAIQGLKLNVERKLYWIEQLFSKVRHFL